MENTCVDLKAREDLAKLWTEVRQHSTDWWGPDKQNGKRSELVEVTTRISKLEVDWKHFQDTRESSCIGVRALREYLDGREAEDAEMRIEQVKGKTLMAIQWVQVLGLVVVALIALIK